MVQGRRLAIRTGQAGRVKWPANNGPFYSKIYLAMCFVIHLVTCAVR